MAVPAVPANVKLPSKIKVYFAARADCVRPWERMFLCGNAEQLGNWEPEKALEMTKDDEAGVHGGDGVGSVILSFIHAINNDMNATKFSSIWRATVELDCAKSCQMLKFRYFIGYRLQSDPMDAKSARFLVKF